MSDNEQHVLDHFPSDPGVVPSTLDFPVVGIGASAGGIVALQRFLTELPSSTGMAFVIVLHLAPDQDSAMAAILQLRTRMPVMQVTGTVGIERDHVYVIPPKQDLVMNDSALHIVPAARTRGVRTAIDKFFRALAEVHRERAVGVILSGAGSDGAVGIARIKEMGGVTMAQAPDDAEHAGMPQSAIATGTVDFVLPVVEMPQKLIELARNTRMIVLPKAGELSLAIGHGRSVDDDEHEQALRDILTIILQRTGHDFRQYKRATILRRIERRLQVAMLPDVRHYRNLVETDPNEVFALLQDLLISVTNFFRDREAFEALERDVIPRIFQATPADEQIRSWTLGCATGEEAYSVAMLLADQNALQPAGGARSLQVFASDIDARALAVARAGMYSKSIVTDLPPARLRRYFEMRGEHYCIKRELRDTVLFAIHNVLRDPPFSRVHLLTCRNLLIYLDRDVQRKVFEMMHYALQPDGFLFLGNAESADSVPHLFTAVDKRNRIYQPVKSRVNKYITPMTTPGTIFPVAAAPAAAPVAERKERPVQRIYLELIQDIAPPSIMVDEHNDVVYASRSAVRFMRPLAGEPTQQVLDLVHPDLQLELRAALFQANKTGQVVEAGEIPVRLDTETVGLHLKVRPDRRQDGGSGMSMLLFEAREIQDDALTARANVAELSIARHLEDELRNTKEQLRGLIDQYEATMGDLKASNEELQAVNEELRSAMEELETSKEELQSVNEELLTVNLELKSKIDETTKSNDDLQNFLAATEISTIFVDRQFRIKRYSKPTDKLFNLISSDIGRPLADITHRLAYPDLLADIEDAVEHLRSTEREVRSIDGGWYLARLLPYRTSADKIDGVVVTFVNISQRKAAEQQLLASEQRMRLIAASTQDYAIATLDQQGIVTSWNFGAERVFGYPESEMLGRSIDTLLPPEERSQGLAEAELQRALDDGRVERERWLLRKDGAEVFCSDITTLLQDDRVRGFVKIARDLTGSKRMLEQQTAQLEWEKHERSRAEHAARARDHFLLVLSHEVKGPLNQIQLASETLQQLSGTGDADTLARAAATIKDAIQTQVRMIDDATDLTRLRTGRLSIERGSVDMRDALQQAVDIMRPSAAQHEVTITTELSANALIHGDAIRIRQLAWNLLRNAITRSVPGSTVALRLSTEGMLVCVEVQDSGIGFAPARLRDVFESSRSGALRHTAAADIAVLGLTLVKELATGHGGWLEVESADGVPGARFRVYLPRVVAGTPAPAAGQDRPSVLQGRRILLIQGDGRTLTSMSNLLAHEQAVVSGAGTASEALQVASEAATPFDLVLTDVILPDMSGLELLSLLRQQPGYAQVPAIAMGGQLRDGELAALRSAGFARHLGTPFSLACLNDAIAQLAPHGR
ncbi:chemotaxis protein CheB [Herbaspirillum sp. SJZ107]|uniref:chemotaxis protein CheB n=1 Tax=Herbaspirillum sp. SJZ107 TaxID=2572881 RepID=UPI0011511288|nr:chemotaxis protein CheB [Herbaspirillum sp. SJZ107]TQK08228.1 two-component system CheB/CheR fusion protein [Herbaspirillum sp. SJZ107]